MLAISTGRRPIRSLSRPQSGAVSIDISEKIASSTVTCLRRGGKALGVERQQRDDEAEPDEIDEDDEEQGRHAPLIAPAPRGTSADCRADALPERQSQRCLP